jgi:hypothetical protein
LPITFRARDPRSKALTPLHRVEGASEATLPMRKNRFSK